MISGKELHKQDWQNLLRAMVNNKRKDLARTFYRTRNHIQNGVWPTSFTNIKLVFFCVSFVLITAPPSCSPFINTINTVQSYLYLNKLPSLIQVVVMSCLSTLSICLTIMYVRRYMFRIILSYRGWMYERASKLSTKTFLWGILVRAISGHNPSLYSCQKSLPRMPVPSLNQTISKLLENLRVICTEDQYKAYEQQARDFEKGPGKTLQRILVLRSWFVSNYVSDWWEKYVYMRSRSPLPNNTNYYSVDRRNWNPYSTQSARAAFIVYQAMVFKRSIDREELPPQFIANTVPICMQQYERILSTTRIPKEDEDELVHYDSKDSKHIVVLCKGWFYKMDVFDEKNQLIAAHNLQKQFKYILEDTKAESDNADERLMANLTSLDRNDWANIRKTHFRGCKLNRASLETIESAVLSIALTDYVPTDMSDKGEFLMHGKATGAIWFDKSYSPVVFSDGQAGIHAEHSMADALPIAHLWECTINNNEIPLVVFTDEGDCMPQKIRHKQAHFEMPVRLQWNITEQLKFNITRATKLFEKSSDDLDLYIREHDEWGKGVMKMHKISPDGFVQMALQLAYYRDSNQQLPNTYEASMTRLYYHGRTETIRSCSSHASQFIKSMDDKAVSAAEKQRLLRQAVGFHQTSYQDAMNGKGIDRHLFTLLVLSRGLGYDTKFLSSVLSIPWTLSTSQQPQNQERDYLPTNGKHFWNKVCPGGGFAPTCSNGYGVSYMIPRDGSIFFHVSSWKSSPATNSKRFMDNLNQAMEDMKLILEMGEANNNEKNNNKN